MLSRGLTILHLYFQRGEMGQAIPKQNCFNASLKLAAQIGTSTLSGTPDHMLGVGGWPVML